MKFFKVEQHDKLLEKLDSGAEMTYEELLQLNKSLCRENRYFWDFMDKNPGGLAIFVYEDGELTMTHCNLNARMVMGVNGSEKGCDLIERIHPEQKDEVQIYVNNFSVYEGYKKKTLRFYNSREERYVWLNFEANFVHQSTGAVEIYIMVRDISKKRKVDNDIKFSKERFEHVIDLAHLCYWDFDIQTRRVLNDNGSFFGLPEFQVMKDHDPEYVLSTGVVEPDSEEAYLQIYRELDQGKKSVFGEFWCYKPEWPRRRCFSIQYNMTYDKSGEPKTAEGVAREITDQKAAIEVYSNHLNSVVKLNPDSIATFRFDISRNWVGMGSSKYKKLLHLQDSKTMDEFLEGFQLFLLYTEERKQFEQMFNRSYMFELFQNGQSHLEFDFQTNQFNRKMNWYRIRMEMLQNPVNHSIEAVMYCTDVSREKAVTRLMHLTLQNDLMAAAVINKDTRKCFYYTVFDNNDGRFADDFMQVFYELAVSVENQKMERVRNILYWERIRKETEETGELLMTYPVECEDGEKQMHEVHFKKFPDHDDILFFSVRDITTIWRVEREKQLELKKALAAEQHATKARSMFLSNVSHDMRTPLNSILGFLPMVKEETDERERNDLLNKIEDSSEYLLGLVNDTLNLSKLETGHIALNLSAVTGQQIEDKVLANIQRGRDEKHVHLEFSCDYDNNRKVMLDSLRVQEIFINILSNSIKFVQTGGHISCHCSLVHKNNERATIKVEISDDGIGMSPEFVETIFDPFTQENPHETGNASGSGIGMAITKQLVELMDGTVSVESGLGEGTVFTVVLTFDYAKEEEPVEKAEETYQLEGRKVLVVEDHALNIELVKRLLQKQNMDVTLAKNGREAVDAFMQSENGYFDIILMDLMMPVMDGYEATKLIRSLDRKDRGLPILAMTANVNEEDQARTKKIGMNAHLGKPINPKVMFKTIDEQIKKYRG